MLQLSYSVPSLKQIHFCSLARGEAVSWQISLGSHEHISSKNKKHPCVCVSVWFYVCGQLQSREFALQSVNMPDNTTVAGRLIRIQLLISSYILITHQPYFIQNHLLIPSILNTKHIKLQKLW